jgi:hypothetical protein
MWQKFLLSAVAPLRVPPRFNLVVTGSMLSSTVSICVRSLLPVSGRISRSRLLDRYRFELAGTSQRRGRARYCCRRTELRFIMLAYPSVELVGVP